MSATPDSTLTNPQQLIADLERQLAEREAELAEALQRETATTGQELAELRRANAELRNERDAALTELQARSAALAQRNSEYSERVEQQSATIDVLKAMLASARDPQPVFELIARRACELCNAPSASVLTELRRFEHSWEPKYLSLLKPTPEGRHYSGVGGTGAAVILGGGWAGSSSLSFCSNRRSSASGSV